MLPTRSKRFELYGCQAAVKRLSFGFFLVLFIHLVIEWSPVPESLEQDLESQSSQTVTDAQITFSSPPSSVVTSTTNFNNLRTSTASDASFSGLTPHSTRKNPNTTISTQFANIYDDFGHLSNFDINWDLFLSDPKLFINASNSSSISKAQSLGWDLTFSTETELNAAHATGVDKTYFDDQWVETLAKGIKWHNNEYRGSCTPYFHTHTAFPTVFDPAAQFAVQNEGIGYYTQHSGSSKVLEANMSVYEWYNSSFARDDLLRKQWFDKHDSQWRFEDVIINDINGGINGPKDRHTIEIIVAKNMNKYGQHTYDFEDGSRPEDAKHTVKMDASVIGNRFLCVFSDGTTVVSDRVAQRDVNYPWIQTVFVVHCPLPPQVEDKLSENWHKDTSLLQTNNKLNLNEMPEVAETQIGLILFSLHPKGSKLDMLNQLLISINVQLPICYKVVKNRAPRLYQSESDYLDLSKDEQQQFTLGNNIHFSATANKIFNNTKLNQSKKHFLATITRVYPKSLSGQPMLLLQQYIDYHLFQGFEHFHMYDHLISRHENSISPVYDTLTSADNNYIQNNVVTYLHTFAPRQDSWSSQHTMFMIGTKFFKYENQFVSLTDMDEWYVVRPLDSSVSDLVDMNFESLKSPTSLLPTVREVYMRHSDQFNFQAVQCLRGYPNFVKISDSFPSKSSKNDCNVEETSSRFDSFAERQSCLVYRLQNDNINDTINSLPTEKLQEQARSIHKYLRADPSKFWMGFANQPKILLDPTILHNGWMHYLQQNNLNQDMYFKDWDSIESKQFEVFVHHLADHSWQTGSSKSEYNFDYKNPNDEKLFMLLSQPKCDFEDSIQYWNDRFLNSKFGARYKNKALVNPLMDRNARFCYLDDSIKNDPDLEQIQLVSQLKKSSHDINNFVVDKNDHIQHAPSEWSVNWQTLQSLLLQSKFAETTGSLTAWNEHLSDTQTIETLKTSIVWNNKHFKRVCTPGPFVPNYAFISVDEMDSISLLNGTLIQKHDQNNQFKSASERYEEMTLSDINWDHYKWWFNTTELHDDLHRTNWLREQKVQYRIDGVLPTIIDDRFMVEIMLAMHAPADYANQQGWSVSFNRFEDHDSAFDIENENSRFLCVFSDGTTVLTRPEQNIQNRHLGGEKYYSFFINCDVTDHSNLVEKIFSNNREGINGKEEPISDIGVTIFSLRPKQSKFDLFNEFIIGMNVELPVCNRFVTNRKPRMYTSEQDFYDIGKENDFFTSHSIFHTDPTSFDNLEDFASVESKYKLSAWTIAHPGSRMHEQDTNLKQWIDWHLMLGFEHFIIYDHLNDRSAQDIDTIYDALVPYIKKGVVTHIEWSVPIHRLESRQYQNSAIMHCVKMFRYDSDYLSLTDIDEWIVVEDVKDVNNNQIDKLVKVPDALAEMENKYNEGERYDVIRMGDYRAWGTDLYTIFNGVDGSETSSAEVRKYLDTGEFDYYHEYNRIGCENGFDTFISRQNCVYASVGSEKYLNMYEMEKNQSESENKEFNSNNHHEMEIIKSLIETECGFQILPKLIVNPRSCYSCQQHDFKDASTFKSDVQAKWFWVDNYEIFAVHTADHYRPDSVGAQCYGEFLPQMSDANDVQTFVKVVNSECRSQRAILNWNKMFLDSEFGSKYLGRNEVKPIMDYDGTLCYLKAESEKFHWIDEN